MSRRDSTPQGSEKGDARNRQAPKKHTSARRNTHTTHARTQTSPQKAISRRSSTDPNRTSNKHSGTSRRTGSHHAPPLSGLTRIQASSGRVSNEFGQPRKSRRARTLVRKRRVVESSLAEGLGSVGSLRESFDCLLQRSELASPHSRRRQSRARCLCIAPAGGG